MDTEARHLLGEYWDCPTDLLDDLPALERLLRAVSEASGLTVLSVASHRFAPQGVTVMALLSESHASIHTWPEAGYAAVDLYSCGADPTEAHPRFVEGLRAGRSAFQVVTRGQQPPGA